MVEAAGGGGGDVEFVGCDAMEGRCDAAEKRRDLAYAHSNKRVARMSGCGLYAQQKQDRIGSAWRESGKEVEKRDGGRR
jgi:hypothetical protein